jgi:hypothetical protein
VANDEGGRYDASNAAPVTQENREEVTKAIDGDGAGKAIEAARLAAVERFALVSIS